MWQTITTTTTFTTKTQVNLKKYIYIMCIKIYKKMLIIELRFKRPRSKGKSNVGHI